MLPQEPRKRGVAIGPPLVERIAAEDPRPAALVLTSTRELATQIVDETAPAPANRLSRI